MYGTGAGAVVPAGAAVACTRSKTVVAVIRINGLRGRRRVRRRGFLGRRGRRGRGVRLGGVRVVRRRVLRWHHHGGRGGPQLPPREAVEHGPVRQVPDEEGDEGDERRDHGGGGGRD